MPMLLSVYRAADMPDCSNNGISARHTRLIAINIPGPFEPRKGDAVVVLQNHYESSLRLVPAVFEDGRWIGPPRHVHYMFGGNFAYTSDSRFSQKCRELSGQDRYGAVPIHDRQE